jgi:hypothetical protein
VAEEDNERQEEGVSQPAEGSEAQREAQAAATEERDAGEKVDGTPPGARDKEGDVGGDLANGADDHGGAGVDPHAAEEREGPDEVPVGPELFSNTSPLFTVEKEDSHSGLFPLRSPKDLDPSRFEIENQDVYRAEKTSRTLPKTDSPKCTQKDEETHAMSNVYRRVHRLTAGLPGPTQERNPFTTNAGTFSLFCVQPEAFPFSVTTLKTPVSSDSQC